MINSVLIEDLMIIKNGSKKGFLKMIVTCLFVAPILNRSHKFNQKQGNKT